MTFAIWRTILVMVRTFFYGLSGGDEPLPVAGHLGSGEPIVKPTDKVGFYFLEEVMDSGNKDI